MEEDLYKYPMKKYIAEGRQSSLTTWGLSTKVLPRPLSDLSAWVGILHLKPTAECQISTLIFEYFFMDGGVLYKYPMKNISKDCQSSLTTWSLNQSYFPGL